MVMATYTLEDLLSTDVVKSSGQVLNTSGNIGNLALVAALDVTGTDNHVELELDSSIGVAGGEPGVATGG